MLVAALLSACSAVQPTDSEQAARENRYESRLGRLSKLDAWSLEGRLAISTESDGGSGYFSWRELGDSSRMDFHGALGRGAWRLVADANGAVLELADGSSHRADTVDELVRKQVGWEIPVDTLAWWVRGLAAPGKIQRRVLDEQGKLLELGQRDWSIEYGRYRAVGGEQLPAKMTARQAEKSVKLAIRNWELAAGQAAHE